MLEGFGFGAALLAMFMRVGGGIFTKAADVGADLVGKVEQHIPEDDPRNAATIADNVGDNVGDCAGMAADLFESYAVTLVAALILGKVAFGEEGLIFPLIITSVGALTAALGVFITKVRDGEPGLRAINRGFYTSAAVGAVLSAIASFVYLPSSFSEFHGSSLADLDADPRIVATVAVFIGIGLAGVILWLTGYFTDTASKPTKRVAETSRTGAATVVLVGHRPGTGVCGLHGHGDRGRDRHPVLRGRGFAVARPVPGGARGLRAAHHGGRDRGHGHLRARERQRAGHRGDVGRGGRGGVQDPHGPGRCGQHHQGDHQGHRDRDCRARRDGAVWLVLRCRQRGDRLRRGIGHRLHLRDHQPAHAGGVIIGGATVFLFSGLAIDAVTRAAGAIVFEVRRQFREMPGIMTGEQRPEYGRVVDICTRDSLRELTTPGLLAAMAPVFVGFGLGVGALAGFLAGAIGSGVLMAVFLSNSGGAWDNAKKIVEDGKYGGKNSPAHEATIIGDTIGDPFKDTAGPAINPLIKVMNLVAVLIAPAVVALSYGDSANPWVRWGIAIVAAGIAVFAVASASRRSHAGGVELEADEAAIAEGHDGRNADVSVVDRAFTQVDTSLRSMRR